MCFKGCETSLAWPMTPLQDRIVLSQLLLLHDLCRANQNQYSHASSRQMMVAMCYLENNSLFLKQPQKLAIVL